MRHLDLCSGIGGFALAAGWSGIKTVAFCEIDKECQRVLNKNFNRPRIHQDIRKLNGKKYKGIGLITAGYPCQGFSVAGNRKAEKDHRYLWGEVFRIIKQSKPTFAICENVYGHVNLGLDKVLHDLESINYSTQSFIVPSLSVGRNHRRDRVFIVAYSSSNGFNWGKVTKSIKKTNENIQKRKKKDISYERRCSVWSFLDRKGKKIGRRGTKSPPLRVANELPRRMDRVKMLGNSVDPLIIYNLMRCINNG